jgi:hypothetical protein
VFGNVGTAALGDGNMVYTTAAWDREITITDAAVRITAGNAASAVIRVGIYASDDDGGKPTDLVHEFATFDISTTGLKSQTGLSVALPAGSYVVSVRPEGATPTIVIVNGSHPGTWTSFAAGLAAGPSTYATGTGSGTLPDPASTPTVEIAGVAWAVFRWEI